MVACGSAMVLGCQSKTQPEAAPEAAKPAPEPEKPAAPVVESPVSAAKQIYRLRCTVCHGESGRGDGPGGAALEPKPRSFTDSVWQDSVKDEQLRAIIVKGGAGVGKSPGMPPNPDLEQKPEVVDELVKLVRGFKS